MLKVSKKYSDNNKGTILTDLELRDIVVMKYWILQKMQQTFREQKRTVEVKKYDSRNKKQVWEG